VLPLNSAYHLENFSHRPSSLPVRTNHPLPSTQSLTFFQHKSPGITSNFTSRVFSASAPSTWNSLSAHIRSLDKLSTIKRQLKSHLLQFAFLLLPSSHPVPAPQIRFTILALGLYNFLRTIRMHVCTSVAGIWMFSACDKLTTGKRNQIQKQQEKYIYGLPYYIGRPNHKRAWLKIKIDYNAMDERLTTLLSCCRYPENEPQQLSDNWDGPPWR